MTNCNFKRNCILLIFPFLMILGCVNQGSETRLEQNLGLAGKNRSELEKVFTHFQQKPQDSLKLKSAIFLISNMETSKHYGGKWLQQFDHIFERTASLDNVGIKKLIDSIEDEIGTSSRANIDLKNDLMNLSAEYLIKNIEEAYDSWQIAPWKSSVSFFVFCNYILPYKLFSEYPENWRNLLRDRYQYILNDQNTPKDMADICCALVDEEKTWFRYTEDFFNYPSAISINNILIGRRGDCREMANLATYSARALGIPVAIDYTPQWANHSSGHIWNALILTDSTFLPFLGVEGWPGDYTSIRDGDSKPAKVFRRATSYIESSFAARAERAGVKKIPRYLKDPRIIDVTSYYTSTTDLTLPINGKNGTPVYLCVFQRGDWEGIAGGLIEDNKVSFEHIGSDILYMPMFYGNKFRSAASPIIIPIKEKKKELIPDKEAKISMKLFRKYPLKKFSANHQAHGLNQARVEGADSNNFKNSTVLYIVPRPGEKYRTKIIDGYPVRDRLEHDSLWEQADIPINQSFRFVRMIREAGNRVSLGELEFYSQENNLPLTGIPIGSVPNPGWAFDGLPGNSIIQESQTGSEYWVGLDLGKKTSITKIRYLPANDKYAIIPNKMYELNYWKNKWVSLGVQKSKGHYLEFESVPSGGLYWLHCIDCYNAEERPFTYENGKQIWW